jgi:glutathione S-transferase
MTSYKLTYFDIKGRAEPIRMLFELAKQPYEDCRVPFEKWGEIKTQFPFHQLPILEVSEKSETTVIPQTFAIARYLANKFGLAGKTDLEKAQCDSILYLINDIVNSFIFPIIVLTDSDDKSAKWQNNLKVSIPEKLKLIEKILYKSKSGFLVGDSITYVDLFLINFYDWLLESKDGILDAHSNLKKHYDKVSSVPVINKRIKENEYVRLSAFTKQPVKK